MRRITTQRESMFPLEKPFHGFWLAGVLVLVLATIAIYAPGLNNELVWDDRPNLLENPHIRGLSGANMAWAFTESHVGHYQPLTWLSFMIDFVVWNGKPTGYHVTNLVLHAVNGILFSCVALVLLGRVAPGASRMRSAALVAGTLVATALFMVHPLRVESVAWATQRRDVLCGLFFLLSILAYLTAVHRGEDGELRISWFVAAIVLFASSLLSKASGMALPVVLLAMDVYPLKRAMGTRSARWRIVLEKLPFLLLALGSAAVAFAAQSETGAAATIEAHGVLERLAQACYGIVFYVRAYAHASFYPMYELPFPLVVSEMRFVVSAVIVLLVTAVAIWKHRQWPALAVAWLSFVALLGPILGLAQSGSQLVADRYTYFAGLVVAVVLGGLVVRAWMRWPVGARAVLATIAFALTAWWMYLSIEQVSVWRNEEVLWRHVLEGGPSSMAENNLGVIADQRGEMNIAVEHFTRSLEVAPRYQRARENLVGQLAGRASRLDERVLPAAVSVLRRSLEISQQPDGEAWYALGAISLRMNQHVQAIEDFEQATKLLPRDGMSWVGLALARDATGDRNGAIAALEHALKVEPGNASAATLLRQLRGG